MPPKNSRKKVGKSTMTMTAWPKDVNIVEIQPGALVTIPLGHEHSPLRDYVMLRVQDNKLYVTIGGSGQMKVKPMSEHQIIISGDRS